MYFSIDRFEGGIAVCIGDFGSTMEIPLSDLPEGAKEGSIITFDGAGGYELCSEHEKEKRKTNFNRAENMFD